MNQYNIIMKEIIHPVKFQSGEQEQRVNLEWALAEYEAYGQELSIISRQKPRPAS